MALRDASDVARRCLCLELLLQRLGLEIEKDDPVAARDDARRKWLDKLPELGLDSVMLPAERAAFERPVGALTEDELDDIHGRAVGALVLLWSLARLPERPSFGTVDDLESLLADHGLLGSGSISGANAAASSASLRPQAELDEALAAYMRLRGKAREPSEPDRIVAGIGAHHVEWILDREMSFEDAGEATSPPS